MATRKPQPAMPLREALDHVVAAIEILDREGAPEHIAARLDFVDHLLRQEIAVKTESETCASDDSEHAPPTTE